MPGGYSSGIQYRQRRHRLMKLHQQAQFNAMQAWLSHLCCVFLLAFVLCTVSCCFQVHCTFSTSWEKAVLCDEARQCCGSFSLGCADGGQRTESLFPSEVVFVPLAYSSKGSRQGKPSGYSHWVGLSWRHQRACREEHARPKLSKDLCQKNRAFSL